jgi:hypothetical protein
VDAGWTPGVPRHAWLREESAYVINVWGVGYRLLE